MEISTIAAIVAAVCIFIFIFFSLKNFSFDTRKMARIAVVAAITMILYMIKLVPFPQGGGCTLLSVLPIMVLSVMYGMEEGVICAILVACLKLVVAQPYYLAQIPFDYFGGMLGLALVPIFGTKTKGKLFSGAVVACLISTLFSVLSGALLFGQFAPEGMNKWVYSLIYNFSGGGVECAIAIFVLLTIPFERLAHKRNIKQRA